MHIGQIQPLAPLVLGTPLRAKVGDALAEQFHLDELILFAGDGGGAEYCYVRSDPDQIKAFQNFGGAGGIVDDEADDFAGFIGQQILDPLCASDEFIALVGDALRAIQDGRDGA